ncbi:MAG: hypothetical protein R3E79_51375 [Caldilineaceae bacterium]
MIQHFAKHHNKIQFFGYEVANLVLVAQQLWLTRGTGYGLNLETMAALGLLLGSALIWGFDPKRRPQLLFYGGMALAVGGAFFTAAGYTWTGLSIIVSALETARGGLNVLNAWVEEEQWNMLPLPIAIAIHWRVARWSLHGYCRMVAFIVSFAPGLGRFIDERPFITGTLIKAPLRLEFIGKKLLVGDPIGAAVGLSWLLLGDLALAFNDAGLQAYAQQSDAGSPVHRSYGTSIKRKADSNNSRTDSRVSARKTVGSLMKRMKGTKTHTNPTTDRQNPIASALYRHFVSPSSQWRVQASICCVWRHDQCGQRNRVEHGHWRHNSQTGACSYTITLTSDIDLTASPQPFITPRPGLTC